VALIVPVGLYFIAAFGKKLIRDSHTGDHFFKMNDWYLAPDAALANVGVGIAECVDLVARFDPALHNGRIRGTLVKTVAGFLRCLPRRQDSPRDRTLPSTPRASSRWSVTALRSGTSTCLQGFSWRVAFIDAAPLPDTYGQQPGSPPPEEDPAPAHALRKAWGNQEVRVCFARLASTCCSFDERAKSCPSTPAHHWAIRGPPLGIEKWIRGGRFETRVRWPSGLREGTQGKRP
jgi:hypothetical protein